MSSASTNIDPVPQHNTPFICDDSNPFHGHYAHLLYYAHALQVPFNDLRRPELNRTSHPTFDAWRNDASVHQYTYCAITHLAEFLEDDPTAICDDPFVIRFATSLSRLLDVLSLSTTFSYDAQKQPWFMDVSKQRLPKSRLFQPLQAAGKYPRDRVSPVDPQYTWDHRILDTAFARLPCAPHFAQLLDEAWETFRQEHPKLEPSPDSAIPPPSLTAPTTTSTSATPSAKEILAKVARVGQRLPASSSGLPPTASSTVLINNTPVAETRNTTSASQLFDDDIIVLHSTGPVSSSSVEPPRDATPKASSTPTAPAPAPVRVAPREVVPETSPPAQERELVMPSATTPAPPTSPKVPSPRLSVPPGDKTHSDAESFNEFEGYYAQILHLGKKLRVVLRELKVRPFDVARLTAFRSDKILLGLSLLLFRTMSEHLRDDPHSLFDDEFIIRMCLSTSRIACILAHFGRYQLPETLPLWWIDGADGDIHSDYLATGFLPDDDYPRERPRLDTNYDWSFRALAIPIRQVVVSSSVAEQLKAFYALSPAELAARGFRPVSPDPVLAIIAKQCAEDVDELSSDDSVEVVEKVLAKEPLFLPGTPEAEDSLPPPVLPRSPPPAITVLDDSPSTPKGPPQKRPRSPSSSPPVKKSRSKRPLVVESSPEAAAPPVVPKQAPSHRAYVDVPPRLSGSVSTSQTKAVTNSAPAPTRPSRRETQAPGPTITIRPRASAARSPEVAMDVDQSTTRSKGKAPAQVPSGKDKTTPSEDLSTASLNKAAKAPRGGAGKSRRNPSAKFTALDEQTNDPDARYSWNRDLHEVAFRRHSQTITDEMTQVATIGKLIGCFGCITSNDPDAFNSCSGPQGKGGKCTRCKGSNKPCSFQLPYDVLRYIVSHGLLPLVAADPSNVYNAACRLVETGSLLNSANETVRKAGISHISALLDLKQVAMHQFSGTLAGLWSDTFESMVPINRLRELDTRELMDQLADLRANTYGSSDLSQFPGVAAALAAADVDMEVVGDSSDEEPVAGPSRPRGYVNTRPS